jgi:phospholipase/carboxylesterase
LFEFSQVALYQVCRYYVIFLPGLASGLMMMIKTEVQTETVLSCIEIEAPSFPPRHSVIWLHGLGADGNDFASIVPELQLPASLGVRFVFPHAPVMPITMNQGAAMRAWFDIAALSFQAKIDEAGIAASVNKIEQLIAKEEALGIPAAHIILAGFSQGSVIALTTGLLHAKRLGGVMALSGYLPMADKFLQKANPNNAELPIFVAHGTEDTVLPCALGKMTYAALEQAGYPASWYSYPMAHSVCTKEIQDISHWLQTVLTL